MVITIKKIAEICGVSRGTVDRVLNNRGKVKSKTEASVRKVAEEFGYQPHPAGKALSAKKKHLVIGVLLTSEGNPFFDEVIAGIRSAEKEYASYGVQVELHLMQGYDVDTQCRLLKEKKDQVNALLISPICDENVIEQINQYVEAEKFVVTVNNDIENSKRICHVGSDYQNGGRTACGIMGLLTGGKGKIAMFTGSKKILGHSQRIQGFREVMKEKYPEMQEVEFIETNDDDIQAFLKTEVMLKQYPEIDAIYIAAAGGYGICRAVLAAERAKEITIVSSDSTPKIIEMMKKGVIKVTICQHPYTQGYKSMQIIFKYLVNGIMPKKTMYIMKNEIKILENL